MIDNLYAFVDKENKKINTSFQELPRNWRNISGLSFLPDSDLKNLGWIKLTDRDISKYSCDSFIIDSLKGKILEDVAELRWQAQTEAVTYNGNIYVLNEGTINSLYQKRMLVSSDLEKTYNWKTRDSVVQLSGTEIVSLTDAIHDYIQACFDAEAEFASRLSSVSTLRGLLRVNYTIDWPSTEL